MPRRKKNGADQPQPIDEGPAPAGHNIGGIDGQRLRSFIDRIENLETDKAAVATDIKEVYAEAKRAYFDTKTIRRLVKERRMIAEDHLDEQQALFDLYRRALGMFVDTPLGAAALGRVNKPNGATAAPNLVAREAGRTDGMAGNRSHETDWPQGQYGAADYELGYDEGVEQRARANTTF